MNKLIKILFTIGLFISTYSAFATGGGINSISGYSETNPYFNMEGSGTTFKTSVKNLGSVMSYNTVSKTLFVASNNGSVGQLKLYKDGVTAPTSTKTIYTGAPLTSVGMNYDSFSHYTTLVGLTQGTSSYTFPTDNGGFTANNGDIVILKIDTDGTLLDYSYIQKKSGTSLLNPNIHTVGTSTANGLTMIGGSIDGKGVLIEIESTTGDISRIVEFSSTSNVYSAIPMSIANKISVAVKFNSDHGGQNAILIWNTSTNSFEEQLELTNSDNIYDMVWMNSTTGYVLFDYTTTTANIGVVGLTNASGRDSVFFKLNLTNNTPDGIVSDLGNNSSNDIRLTRLFKSATGENYIYANGTYSGNGFPGWLTDITPSGSDGLLVEFNPTTNPPMTSLFTTHLSSDNSFIYTTAGDSAGTFYATDSNGYMYRFGDASNVSTTCGAGYTATQIPYIINLVTGMISNYGDQSTIQQYLSSTNTTTIPGVDSSTEIDRITGTYNGLDSSPSYIFNYGFTNLGVNYYDGYSKSSLDSMGWNNKSIPEIKTIIIDTLKSGSTATQNEKNAVISYLKNNLIYNATLSSKLGANPGSYGYFFSNKGVDTSIIDGSNPFYYIDFSRPQATDRATLNTQLYANYFLSARGVNNSKWFKDPDTNNATSGIVKGANDIVWSPLNRGSIYTSDDEFPQLVFPIIKKDNDATEGFVEFACGNLICRDYTKECISPSTVENNKCGNGVIDAGEECDTSGPVLPTGIQTQQPWYTFSCSNSCKLVSTPKPDLSTSTNTGMIMVTVCKPNSPTATLCGNGIVENGEQCELGVNGATLENCNPQTCQSVSIDVCSVSNPNGTVRPEFGQTCSPNPLDPKYDVNCSDGTNTFPGTPICQIHSPSSCGDGKIDKNPTNRPSESCDYGTNNEAGNSWVEADRTTDKTQGGKQCSNSCTELSPPDDTEQCGNDILEKENGEQCEIKADGDILWDTAIQAEATASGSLWRCTGTGGLNGLGPKCKATKLPVCGDGIIQSPEECDGGAGCYGSGGISGHTELACTMPKCGNGIVESSIGETCEPSINSSCNSSCTYNSTGSVTVECKEDVAFTKSQNFLTFNSKTFNGDYEIWTWNGGRFTKQTIRYPDASEVLSATTENSQATIDLKSYMAEDFVQKLVENKLFVPKDRVFHVKNRYLSAIALQSVFFDTNNVIGGGYVRTGFGFLTNFYDDGVKMEVQALKCSDTSTVTRQAVTNIIGVIDTATDGIYLIKSWGSSLPDYTSFWKDRG